MPGEPSRDPVLPRVLAIVDRIAGPNRRPPTPGAGTHLAAGGFWLDSIDLLELMIACDETFGAVFGGAGAATMDEVDTVGDLVAVIEARAGH